MLESEFDQTPEKHVLHNEDGENIQRGRPELIDSVDNDTIEFREGIYPPSRIWVDARKQLLLQPNIPLMTVANGLPVSGKTTYLRQGLDWMFSNEVTEIALREIYSEHNLMLSDSVNTDILEFDLPWGDTFYGQDESIRVREDYDDPEVRERKEFEIKDAVHRLSSGIQATIRTASEMVSEGETRPIIIQLDMNTLTGCDLSLLTSGSVVGGVQEVGLRRGDDLYSSLIHHTGPFDRKEMQYNDYHIGMYRSKKVFNIGLAQRTAIEESSSIETRIERLRQSGIYIDIQDSEELEAYLDTEQSARPNEMFQLEKDVYKPLEAFYKRGLIEQNVGESFEDFMSETKRSQMIFENAHAQYLHAYMIRYLNIPHEKLTLGANRTVLSSIHVEDRNVRVERIRPLREWLKMD